MRRLCLALAVFFLAVPLALAEPPVEFREVIAEGRAAIDFEGGGVAAARKMALAEALRAALEKTVGVYVSARTLTQNYQVVRDQVSAHTDGFVALREVLQEQVGPQEVRLRVRAAVSVRPLAQQLRALGLTRRWRIHVQAKESERETAAEGVVRLERQLQEAGFTLAERPAEADIVAMLVPVYTEVAARPLQTAAGPMTMHTLRSDVRLRATRVGVEEVVASAAASETALHIHPDTARSQATTAATEAAALPLIDRLLLLPAASVLPMKLVVRGLDSLTQVMRLEAALARVVGVDQRVRRSFGAGRAVWELSVRQEVADLLAHDLRNQPLCREWGLTVVSETRAQIVLGPAMASSKKSPPVSGRPWKK